MSGIDVRPDAGAAPRCETLALLGKQFVKPCAKRARLKALGWQRAVCIVSVSLLSSATWAQTVIPKNIPGTAASEASIAKSTEPAPLPAPSVVVPATEQPAKATAVEGQSEEVVATAATVKGNGMQTVFALSLSRTVPVQVFALANPYRVVVDLPNVAFQLPPAIGRSGQGLVGAFRYGLFSAARSRVVIDTTGPVRATHTMTAEPTGGVILHLKLEPTTAEMFAAALVQPQEAAPNAQISNEKKANQRPATESVFVIMIDPGHGGVDAGAIGGDQIAEKDIVLSVARQLKSALAAKGRYDVRMTRTSDTFVSLDQRVALSEAAGASLFISIHADSVSDAGLARNVHGAAIYTLSEMASHRAAQALAEKENSADAAGGLGANEELEATQVNSILADLAKRETASFSSEFQQLLLDRMRPVNMLARDPARSAAFKVLRQTQTPTVLIELGFISHQADAAQMQLIEWQKRVATTIASAVDSFAAKHDKRSR